MRNKKLLNVLRSYKLDLKQFADKMLNPWFFYSFYLFNG